MVRYEKEKNNSTGCVKTHDSNLDQRKELQQIQNELKSLSTAEEKVFHK